MSWVSTLCLELSFVNLFVVQKLGFYLPWILGGSAISAVGYGLLSMLTPTFPGATRIGFQIMAGVGCGSAATMVTLRYHSKSTLLANIPVSAFHCGSKSDAKCTNIHRHGHSRFLSQSRRRHLSHLRSNRLHSELACRHSQICSGN